MKQTNCGAAKRVGMGAASRVAVPSPAICCCPASPAQAGRSGPPDTGAQWTDCRPSCTALPARCRRPLVRSSFTSSWADSSWAAFPLPSACPSVVCQASRLDQAFCWRRPARDAWFSPIAWSRPRVLVREGDQFFGNDWPISRRLCRRADLSLRSVADRRIKTFGSSFVRLLRVSAAEIESHF